MLSLTTSVTLFAMALAAASAPVPTSPGVTIGEPNAPSQRVSFKINAPESSVSRRGDHMFVDPNHEFGNFRDGDSDRKRDETSEPPVFRPNGKLFIGNDFGFFKARDESDSDQKHDDSNPSEPPPNGKLFIGNDFGFFKVRDESDSDRKRDETSVHQPNTHLYIGPEFGDFDRKRDETSEPPVHRSNDPMFVDPNDEFGFFKTRDGSDSDRKRDEDDSTFEEITGRPNPSVGLEVNMENSLFEREFKREVPSADDSSESRRGFPSDSIVSGGLSLNPDLYSGIFKRIHHSSDGSASEQPN